MNKDKQHTDRSFTFKKSERLCYEKEIERLFQQGKSFVAYPLRVVYLTMDADETQHELCKLLISVPKRKFKRANKRNRIKRLVRETYRLNKYALLDTLKENQVAMNVAVIYLKDELPTYDEMEKGMKKMLLILKDERPKLEQ